MPSSFFFFVLFDRRIMSSSSPLHFLVTTLPLRTLIGNFGFLRSVFNMDLVLGPEDRSGRYGWPSGFVLLCTVCFDCSVVFSSFICFLKIGVGDGVYGDTGSLFLGSFDFINE